MSNNRKDTDADFHFPPAPQSGQGKVGSPHDNCHQSRRNAPEAGESQSAMMPNRVIIARAPLAQLRFDEGLPGEVEGLVGGCGFFGVWDHFEQLSLPMISSCNLCICVCSD